MKRISSYFSVFAVVFFWGINFASAEGNDYLAKLKFSIPGKKIDILTNEIKSLIAVDFCIVSNVDKGRILREINDAFIAGDESKFFKILASDFKNYSKIKENYTALMQQAAELSGLTVFQGLSIEKKEKILKGVYHLKGVSISYNYPECIQGAMFATIGCAMYASNLIAQGYPQSYADQAMGNCLIMVGVYQTICELSGGIWPS